MLIYRMHSILSVFVPMVEKKIPKIKAQSEQLSDSDTPDKEADPWLCTSEEERQYGDNKRIRTGYTGSPITLQSPDEPNHRKKLTTET